jgi:hypothetical protein
VGELFRSLQKEHGAASKVYVDTEGNKSVQVGWVFRKKEKYSDCKEFYEQATWICVSSTEPVKTIINITNPFSHGKNH